MPKIIIHSPDGTFGPEQREGVACELTDFALGCETLPHSPFVKSTVWMYFNDYAAGTVFMGAKPATQDVVSVQIFVIEGGLEGHAKATLISGATEILRRHAGWRGLVPVYIVIHEIPEANWGIFGKQADLAALRNSPPDAPSL